MSLGAVSPMPRIVGPSSAIVAGVKVPTGVRSVPSGRISITHAVPAQQTSVSICTSFLHHNENIFPDPMTFIPERWLEPNSRELDNHMVSFSRGPRSCIGIKWAFLHFIY
jgi:cytochrome P450